MTHQITQEFLVWNPAINQCGAYYHTARADWNCIWSNSHHQTNFTDNSDKMGIAWTAPIDEASLANITKWLNWQWAWRMCQSGSNVTSNTKSLLPDLQLARWQIVAYTWENIKTSFPVYLEQIAALKWCIFGLSNDSVLGFSTEWLLPVCNVKNMMSPNFNKWAQVQCKLSIANKQENFEPSSMPLSLWLPDCASNEGVISHSIGGIVIQYRKQKVTLWGLQMALIGWKTWNSWWRSTWHDSWYALKRTPQHIRASDVKGVLYTLAK